MPRRRSVGFPTADKTLRVFNVRKRCVCSGNPLSPQRTRRGREVLSLSRLLNELNCVSRILNTDQSTQRSPHRKTQSPAPARRGSARDVKKSIPHVSNKNYFSTFFCSLKRIEPDGSNVSAVQQLPRLTRRCCPFVSSPFQITAKKQTGINEHAARLSHCLES